MRHCVNPSTFFIFHILFQDYRLFWQRAPECQHHMSWTRSLENQAFNDQLKLVGNSFISHLPPLSALQIGIRTSSCGIQVLKKKDDTQQQVMMTAAEAKQRLNDALAQKDPVVESCGMTRVAFGLWILSDGMAGLCFYHLLYYKLIYIYIYIYISKFGPTPLHPSPPFSTLLHPSYCF